MRNPFFCSTNLHGFFAYDNKVSHQLITRKGATVCIPHERMPGYGTPGTREIQRYWYAKRGAGTQEDGFRVSRRSLAEAAMSRFKQLMTGKVSLRNYNGQVGELMAYVKVINKLNGLGLPVRKPQA